MSNHHEKDKEGNAFMYSSERENKTFWLFQKQRKMYPTEDCLPHHISATDEKRKKHNLVLHFLLYSATFQVIFSLKRNTSYSQETMSRKVGFSPGGNLGQVSHY